MRPGSHGKSLASVARVLHGVAGRFWKPLENNGNRLQHMQHTSHRAEVARKPFVLVRQRFGLAGELGFEPRFSESESDVLPLNYSPIGRHKWLFYK